MEHLICPSCGSKSFIAKGNIHECEYCSNKYAIEKSADLPDETLVNAKIIQYYTEANQLQASNNLSGELKVLIQALELDNNNALTLVKLGRCYRNLNMTNDAIKMYTRALEINPKIGTAYTNMGTICILNKQWHEAVSYYEQGLKYINKNESDYWVGYANYAVAVANLGDKARAAKMIAEAESHGYTKGNECRQLAGIRKKGCYVATCVYGSYDCPQVWTLRRYRDNILASTWYGRAFISVYYAISPTVVKLFGNSAFFKKLWKNTLDKMVFNLRSDGVEDTPYQDKEW